MRVTDSPTQSINVNGAVLAAGGCRLASVGRVAPAGTLHGAVAPPNTVGTDFLAYWTHCCFGSVLRATAGTQPQVEGVFLTPHSHLKLSECVMEEEERAESTVSSCVSMKSDCSKGKPENFGIGPQGSPLKMDEDRAESTVPSRVSLKSDHSKDRPITFRSSDQM
ncbi:hypothetical protein D4764_0197030 [Takifugu flavidus]|uniref:Uncharacterized protein n=1 Tax=Takifugu flavidus TaxID=433684 RepID=A0A5C6MFD9_9TELE|nr:hypothetical protein D4764_0197030 [Takifugu flavidus]